MLKAKITQDFLASYGVGDAIQPDFVEQAAKAFMERSSQIERKGSRRYPTLVQIGDMGYVRDQGEVTYKFARPAHYSYPTKGESGLAVHRIARAYTRRRHIFIHGDAGSGKSAILRALGHDLNRECSHYAMRESLDPELYLGRTIIEEVNGASVTRFEKGPLLLDFEGRVGKDGIRRPVTICFDDMDRAPAIYHEILRHIMDDNAKSVFVPELKTSIQVFEGTQIVATANSNGRGDSSALYATSQQMDESILDRFNVAIHYPFMSMDEELEILKSRFDLPNKVLSMILNSALLLRKGIEKGEIFGSFSHRRVVNWAQSLQDLSEDKMSQKKTREGIIMEAAKDWMDWFDPEQRVLIVRTLAPVILDIEQSWSKT